MMPCLLPIAALFPAFALLSAPLLVAAGFASIPLPEPYVAPLPNKSGEQTKTCNSSDSSQQWTLLFA
eukprot:6461858-Amphidinium_carterae.1